MVQTMLQSQNVVKLPKAVTLLSNWRKFLKQLNADGCWKRVGPETLQAAQTTSNHASATAEFVNVLKTICVDLPAIMNKIRRQKSAKDFKDKHPEVAVCGQPLEQRLAAIIAGEKAEGGGDDKKAAGDDGDKGEAGDGGEDSNDDEPTPKRMKGKQKV